MVKVKVKGASARLILVKGWSPVPVSGDVHQRENNPGNGCAAVVMNGKACVCLDLRLQSLTVRCTNHASGI